MTQTVLLTGVTGYIGKHVALALLRAGYTVRGTLRELSRGAEVMQALRPHLDDAGDLDARLTFTALDLTRDEGWDAAMTGVDVLMHTASPFPMSSPKDPDALIGPAVEGTRRALRAAQRAGVARVVLTSSVAAISGAPLPAGETAYDETNWTDPDGPGVSTYSRSKTLAEQAAWDFVRQEAPEMKLTVVNPGFVLGAPLDAHYGTSVDVVKRLLKGRDPMLPRLTFPVADVRDVAEVHAAAIDDPDTHGERIMVASQVLSFQDMARIVKRAYPDRRIPTREAPDALIRVLALFDRAIADIVPNLGRRDRYESRRAERVLGRALHLGQSAVAGTAKFLVEDEGI